MTDLDKKTALTTYYENDTSGLVGNNTQEAIDELAYRTANLGGTVSTYADLAGVTATTGIVYLVLNDSGSRWLLNFHPRGMYLYTGSSWEKYEQYIKYAMIGNQIESLWQNATTGGASLYAINTVINYNGLLYRNITGVNTDNSPNLDSTNWEVQGLSSVTTDSSLTGIGTSGSPLGINLNNANIYTAQQGTALVPVADTDYANKKYVDDSIVSSNVELLAVLPTNDEKQVYVGRNNINKNTITYPDFLTSGSWTARDSDREWFGMAESSTGLFKLACVFNGHFYNSNNEGANFTQRSTSTGQYNKCAMSADSRVQIVTTQGNQAELSVNYGIDFITVGPDVGFSGCAVSPDGKHISLCTLGGYIWTSHDEGANFTQKTTALGVKNWAGIAIADDGYKQIAVVNVGYTYITDDGWDTYTQVDTNAAHTACAINDDGTQMMTTIFGGFIRITSDSGATWANTDSSRNWTSCGMDCTGVHRIAVEYNGDIYLSSNSGVNLTAQSQIEYWRSCSISGNGQRFSATGSNACKIYTGEAIAKFTFDEVEVTGDVDIGGDLDVIGVIMSQSTSPIVTLHNTTEEDISGGRESKIIVKGEQSGGEETTLGIIQVYHDGASDDQKGAYSLSLNDGADGDSPTEILKIFSTGVHYMYTSVSGDCLRLWNTAGDANLVLSSSGASSNAARIKGITVGSNVEIAFVTGGGERMRIDQSGWVGIGKTVPTTPLDVNGVITATGGDSNNWNEAYSRMVPTGVILPYGGTSAPTGYLMCTGGSYLRSGYANLFAVIGTAFGAVDATHFNVPDKRGRVSRGVDGGAGIDPDASSRTALYTGGATGDNVGSYQDDQYKSHNHIQGYGAVQAGRYSQVNTGSNAYSDVTTGATSTSGAYTSSSGGNETRMKNVYTNFIIKT